MLFARKGMCAAAQGVLPSLDTSVIFLSFSNKRPEAWFGIEPMPWDKAGYRELVAEPVQRMIFSSTIARAVAKRSRDRAMSFSFRPT